MPPCFDVYVWVTSENRRATLARFIDRYVDRANPGNPRFEAFLRTFVAEAPVPEDAALLAELRRGPDTDAALSLYLRANGFHEAIVTVTAEGDLVLGLGLDDPQNDPALEQEASRLLDELMDTFDGTAGLGGVELPPPGSRASWAQDALVMLRRGHI